MTSYLKSALMAPMNASPGCIVGFFFTFPWPAGSEGKDRRQRNHVFLLRTGSPLVLHLLALRTHTHTHSCVPSFLKPIFINFVWLHWLLIPPTLRADAATRPQSYANPSSATLRTYTHIRCRAKRLRRPSSVSTATTAIQVLDKRPKSLLQSRRYINVVP